MKHQLKIFCLIALIHWPGIPYDVHGQSLDQYMQEAARNNPGLRASYEQYLAALERVPQVGALPDPEVGFGYFISPIETRVGPQQARFSAMQMFPWFKTLSGREDVATALARAKFEEFEAARNSLFLSVQSAWYNLYELQHSTRIATRHLEILGTYEKLAAEKFEKGIGSMVDVLRIQIEIEELQNRIALLRDKRIPLMADFNQALNRDLASDLIVPDSIPAPEFTIGKEALADSIMTGNKHLASIRYREEAVGYAAEVARREGMPSFGIGLNYIVTGRRDGVEVPDNGKNAFLPMMTIRIPLYREKYQAKVEEAQIQKRSLALSREDSGNSLLVQLENVWVDLQDARRRQELYAAQIQTAKQAQVILVQDYSTAGKDFEEILRLERMILNYELEIVKAVRDQYVAVAKIEMLYSKY